MWFADQYPSVPVNFKEGKNYIQADPFIGLREKDVMKLTVRAV